MMSGNSYLNTKKETTEIKNPNKVKLKRRKDKATDKGNRGNNEAKFSYPERKNIPQFKKQNRAIDFKFTFPLHLPQIYF